MSKWELSHDVSPAVRAVDNAIAAEDLAAALALFITCMDVFNSRHRSAAEVDQYVGWLHDRLASIRTSRSHVAHQLSRIGAKRYGRAGTAATWSVNG